MAKYTNGSKTIDATQWAGDFSAVEAFLLSVSPFFVDPKVVEDNPVATGVAELPDGRISVFVGGDPPFQYGQPSDWLARGEDAHLRIVDQAAFSTDWSPVP